MYLRTRMLNVNHLVLTVMCVIQCRGTNIMLNKPAVQSSTYSEYVASNANDGSGVPSGTVPQQNPYWQGDLQGFYTVTNISVSSAADCYGTWARSLRMAFIGVSVTDVSCPENEMTRCGQWPDEYRPGHTIVFECPRMGPVRFVKIWKEVYDYINLAEVEVEGESSELAGIMYEKGMLQKVTTPTMSLSVVSVTGCGTMCNQMQPCLAFSFTEPEQPNCLLATNVTMTSDVKWTSYRVSMCFNAPI